MSIDIVVMSDCASNYGVFHIPSSDGKSVYTVTLSGSEGPAHCNCKAFGFSGAKQTCKHVKQVYDGACLYNPQWHDANPNPRVRPVDYCYDAVVLDKTCECGGPMVAVRRAV